MKAIPNIQKYMTYVPKFIGNDQTLEKALELMQELKIRHLPVLKAGSLVGILSDRDVNLVMTFKDVDPKTETVEEAYSPDPYSVSPNAPLDEVVTEMAEKKYGCAVVMDNHKLVGIFTEIDAFRALADLLHTRLKN